MSQLLELELVFALGKFGSVLGDFDFAVGNLGVHVGRGGAPRRHVDAAYAQDDSKLLGPLFAALGVWLKLLILVQGTGLLRCWGWSRAPWRPSC